MGTEASNPVELFAGSPRSRTVQRLRQWISEGLFDTFPSEHSLAARLGVSRTTVRAAIRQLETEGVIRSEGGNRVFMSPRRSRSLLEDTVAVLSLPTSVTISASGKPNLESAIQMAIIDRLKTQSIHTLCICADRLTPSTIQQWATEHPKGMLALRDALEAPDGQSLLSAMHQLGVPIVAYGDAPSLGAYDTLVSDHESGAYQLTRRLIELGYKRITRFWQRARLDGPRPEWLAQRDAGYTRAIREAGVEYREAIECGAIATSDGSKSKFEMATQLSTGQLLPALKGSSPADAIMCISDGIYGPVAAAIRGFGKTPNQDIAIAGYDNSWDELVERKWEDSQPMLTIDKSNNQIGRALAELLLNRINRSLPPEPQHLSLAPTLIDRSGR